MEKPVVATLEEVKAVRAELEEADHFYYQGEFAFATLKVTMEEQDIITAELAEQ